MATLGALGVVYGDIGTSPLYALREAAKAASGESMPTPEAVLGSLADHLVTSYRRLLVTVGVRRQRLELAI
jgi:K+ transporter